jgi:hypothetical protein
MSLLLIAGSLFLSSRLKDSPDQPAAPNLIDVGAVHPHMSGAQASGAQLSSLLLVRSCP